MLLYGKLIFHDELYPQNAKDTLEKGPWSFGPKAPSTTLVTKEALHEFVEGNAALRSDKPHLRGMMGVKKGLGDTTDGRLAVAEDWVKKQPYPRSTKDRMLEFLRDLAETQRESTES